MRGEKRRKWVEVNNCRGRTSYLLQLVHPFRVGLCQRWGRPLLPFSIVPLTAVMQRKGGAVLRVR